MVELVVFATGVVLCIAGSWLLRSISNRPIVMARFAVSMKSLSGESAHRAVRQPVAASLMLLSLALAFGLQLVSIAINRPSFTALVTITSFGVFIVSLVTVVRVGYSGKPKWLVPPWVQGLSGPEIDALVAKTLVDGQAGARRNHPARRQP